jgi:hypothetical protein
MVAALVAKGEKMKRFAWILVVMMLASPAWAAKKITVQQLKDMLVSLQQGRKTDAEVATELKQVELTEELTRSAMNSLVSYVSGPLSTEQIYVLEARSAVLPPPAVDLPATPAPDAAAQKAILDKAVDYTTKTYAQLPHLTATKTTIRFQDNVEAIATVTGMHSGSSDVDPNLVQANRFIHYINSTEVPVDTQNGAEKVSTAKDKTPWGQNGYIALQGQGPVLSSVLQDAQTAGTISWLRWETINKKAAAVFAFSVDKKKSHYAVSYCCFPTSEQTGLLSYKPGAQGSGDFTAKGNLQTHTTYDQHFNATVPYHGEIFVDPDSGIVVRLNLQAEFKAADDVQQEDQRIDYGPVKVGATALVLPTKTVIDTKVIPNGDSGSAKFTIRRTLFTSEYKNYQLAAQ